MSFLLGVAIFVVALLASIMLHEAGHFATAKMFGMKATQFFIGFGRTIWSRHKGETEYGVKAIPAGGFVKIVGMTDLEDVDPADEPRSFRRRPGWQRIIVLAAGSFMGVSPTSVFQRVGPLGAASYAGHEFWVMLSGSASVAANLPKAIPDLFAKNRADTAGGQVTSVVGAGNVTGQVLEARIGWQPKAGLVLLIIASLNIFVGAFNLLPLLPLDGGHLAVVIYERIRYWFARLLRRPDPGPVDYRRLVPVSVGVFALLVGVGLLLIMADLVNPVHLQ